MLRNGDYKIIKCIGQGGFGITYEAEQVLMKRKVCIKEYYLAEYCEREADTSSISSVTQASSDKMQRYMAKFIKEACVTEEILEVSASLSQYSAR